MRGWVKYWSLILFVCLCNCSICQTNNNFEPLMINHNLSGLNSDTEKIAFIARIIETDTNKQEITSLAYKTDSIIHFLQKANLTYNCYFYLGKISYSNMEYSKALNYFESGKHIAEFQNKNSDVSKIISYILECCYKDKQFTKMIPEYLEFLWYAPKKTDKHLFTTFFLLGIFVFTFLNNVVTYTFIRDKSILFFIQTMFFYLLFYIVNSVKYQFDFRLELYGILIINNFVYYCLTWNYLKFIHNFLLEAGKPILSSAGKKILTHRLSNIFTGFLVLIFILIWIHPANEKKIGGIILQVYSYIFLGLIINLSYLFFKKKHHVRNEIRFIALAQIILALGILSSNIYAYYLGYRNFISEISICTYFALLSVSIADKINFLKQQKEKAQEQALALLEIKVAQRTEELVYQKKRSDDLLLNILPEEVAEELKETGKAQAKFFESVTVLFTDFKGFTTLAERFSAQELVNELDNCFQIFDEIMEKYGIEKIKTIGDAYMAVTGLPVKDKNHAKNMVLAALEIKQFMFKRKQQLGENTFEVRIGIHSGGVVAGIVGSKKFAYDIWGDTVNIAARMEQNSEPGKINISQTTYELIKDKFECSYRGAIEAKNKGALNMYFVENGIILS